MRRNVIHVNNILMLRRRARMSAAQLAAAVIPPSTDSQIYKLEKGETALTLSWMIRIAAGLGCPLHELLPGAGMQDAEEVELLQLVRALGPDGRDRARELLQAAAEDPGPVETRQGGPGDPRLAEVVVSDDGSYTLTVYYRPRRTRKELPLQE
jgi:transcriptional regulator with XRE-family HTH domain